MVAVILNRVQAVGKEATSMGTLFSEVELEAARVDTKVENLGIDPSASRMLSERSTI